MSRAMDCSISMILAEGTQGSLDQTTWIMLVIAAIAAMYVMSRSKLRKKRDPLESRSIGSTLSQERAVERQMSNLLMELTEVSRTVNSGIDARTARLEALLDEADKKIAELRSLNARERAALQPIMRETAATLSSEQPVPNRSETSNSDARHAEVYRMADLGRSAHEIAAALGQPTGEIELILALRQETSVR